MKILVTGGAGFIGYHICRDLLKKDHEVVIIDNFSTGKIENCFDLRKEFGDDNIKVIEGSINNKQILMKAMRDCKRVIHLAAVGQIWKSVKDPTGTAYVNIGGTINILECAIRNKVEEFIFSSSSSVYQESELKQHESSPLNPTSPYGMQKWAAERFCEYYSRKSDMKITIFRFFNVYGSRQYSSSGALIPSLVHGILYKDSVEIRGAGKQLRSFIHISDIVRIVCNHNFLNHFRIYNLGGRPLSIQFIYDEIIRLLDQKPSEVFYLSQKRFDRQNSIVSINRAYSELKIKIKVTIEEGLKEVINWFKTK